MKVATVTVPVPAAAPSLMGGNTTVVLENCTACSDTVAVSVAEDVTPAPPLPLMSIPNGLVITPVEVMVPRLLPLLASKTSIEPDPLLSETKSFVPSPETASGSTP